MLPEPQIPQTEREIRRGTLDAPRAESEEADQRGESKDGDNPGEVQKESRRYNLRGAEARKASTLYPENEWHRAKSAKEEGKDEPQSYKEALAGEDAKLWQKAMDKEIASLLENETWSVKTVLEGVKPVPVKWVYKTKRDANGNVERYKGRVVAKGFKQKHGIDYEEVFAPVSRHPTVRALLVVAAVRDLKIKQLDIKTAFLNGDLEEEIWCDQPEGYSQGGPEKKCRLKKALYGVKQAPRAWYLKLVEEMKKLGYSPLNANSAPFVKRDANEELAYAAVWVDNSLMVGSKETVEQTKEGLAKVFNIRDLGEAKFFLGMDIVREREACKFRLTQKRAVQELLLEYRMENAKGKTVSMSVAEKSTREGREAGHDSLSLRSVGWEPTLSQKLHTARYHSGGGSPFALHERADARALANGVRGAGVSGADT
jgi:hypothetical protein